MKYLRFVFIFVGILFLTLQICYADNINIDHLVNCYCYDYDHCVCDSHFDMYQDIKGCSLQNHLINKKISDFRRFLNLVGFVLSIGWMCCGFVGFL
jgi:hypothetical protein